MNEQLPEPLIDADVDLRDFRYMPFDIVQLLNSETWAMADGWQAKACINLWVRAWHQVPSGSLPNNENLLATWAGVPVSFDVVRDVALRGFILCNDGRLYHKTICEKAEHSWQTKRKNNKRTSKATAARKRKRTLTPGKQKEKDTQRNVDRNVEREEDRNDKRNEGSDVNVTLTKGEGKGKENIERKKPTVSKENAAEEPEDNLDIPVTLDRSDEGKAVKLWNELAERCHLAQVQKITSTRRKKMKARLRDCEGLEGWKAILAKVEASPGLQGKADDEGTWKVDFDFLMSEGNFTKVLEGKYDGWGKQNGGASAPNSEEAQWRARVGSFVKTGNWMGQWGDEPGLPGCPCPPDILAEFPDLKAQAHG